MHEAVVDVEGAWLGLGPGFGLGCGLGLGLRSGLGFGLGSGLGFGLGLSLGLGLGLGLGLMLRAPEVVRRRMVSQKAASREKAYSASGLPVGSPRTSSTTWLG